MNARKQPSGQTMLEAIIATAMLMMATYAILGLNLTTVRGGLSSRNQLIASQLAREGIEAIRFIRDANALHNQAHPDALLAFDDNIKVDDKEFYRADFIKNIFADPTDIQWEIVEETNKTGCVNASCLLRRDDNRGVYSHDPIDSQTPFSRYLQINEICNDGTDMTNGAVCSTNPQNGLHIFSVVKWSEGANDRELSLEARLYDWR